jgi:methionyl-tRNA formyltransferase
MVFCGTPQFAVPSLKKLLSQPDFEIVGVFTQPDRPHGRGQEVSFSRVKEVALAAAVPVHQPEQIRALEVQEQFQALAPEVIVIIAYGQIIPARLLPIPILGWINLHASLLPRYRGAAPIHWAIANGDKVTGNTTMRIDAGMDTGEILLQQEFAIGPDETTPELAARLSEAGADLMVESLRGLREGKLKPRTQGKEGASSAPMLKREDGRIDWNRSAKEIYDRMRGFAPWPGAYAEFRGQTCHVWGHPFETEGGPVAKEVSAGAPGTIVRNSGRLLVLCGAATGMEITHVKMEGRKRISASEFANGTHLQPGEHFAKR